MSRLNRVPKGLQSLLGTKALGRNPDELAEVVRPTVDLTQNYLSEQGLQTVYALEAAVGEGYAGSGVVTVPNGEAWYVYNVSCNFTASAGGSFNGTVGYGIPSTAAGNLIEAYLMNDTDIDSSISVNLPLGKIAHRCFQFPVPTLFPAGTEFFGAFVRGGATVTTRTLVTYARVDI